MYLPCLMARFVSYLHHLLLVDLASINQFFNRASAKQTVNVDITGLAKAISPIHGLKIMGWIYELVSVFSCVVVE